MKPVARTTLLEGVAELQDHLRNYTKDCRGCGSAAPHVERWIEDDSNLLCFTCRQLAYAAANPYRLGIVEGSA